MRPAAQIIIDGLNAPVRRIKFRADVYGEGSNTTKYNIWDNNKLISATIERVGEESKFFGYGIVQKLNIKAIDKERAINILTSDHIRINYVVNSNTISNALLYYPTETHRDEITNQISITAYDMLYKSTDHTYSELNMEPPYTIRQLAQACSNLLGVSNSIVLYNVPDSVMDIEYADGGNFEGTETIREVLNAIAEATQTIYYLDEKYNKSMAFKRLDRDGEPVFTIDKSKYITLDTSDNKRLGVIISATELGDNVSASTTELGSTQIIRDNPLLDLRTDIDTILDNAIADMGGLTICPFECAWRGNFLLEVGDKIALETKDGNTAITYLLDDVMTYNGGLSAKTRWKHSNEEEIASNPTNLQDLLRQTYAKVDKANKEIELVASRTEENAQEISAIRLNTDSITASVEQIEENVNSSIGAVNEDIETLTKRVETSMTAEDVRIEIQTELSNGVDKVITSTGYTFDDEGLTVSKSGSEMKTLISEDGMIVYRDNTEVLVANNEGVEARNLHANTYLIVGKNSRFEDYGNRTGCFWIGG